MQDAKPRWRHKLSEITDDMVNRYFAPLPSESELMLPVEAEENTVPMIRMSPECLPPLQMPLIRFKKGREWKEQEFMWDPNDWKKKRRPRASVSRGAQELFDAAKIMMHNDKSKLDDPNSDK